MDGSLAVLGRLFPVGRGLFEDKVSNFWCSLNIVFKIKDVLPSERLLVLSAGLTLVISLVPNLDLFRRPSGKNFLRALANTSLAFFLFSYQVFKNAKSCYRIYP